MKLHILFALAGLLWMPLAFAQPIIKVSGIEDPLTVKNQIMLYLEMLNVRENIHLSVSFSANIPEEQAGATYCVDSPSSNTYQVIRVWIDARLVKRQQRLVLAHEMIHVKQYAKGELVVISKEEIIWKGKKWWYLGVDQHRTPWEYEALTTDNQLSKRCNEQLETPLVAIRPNR